MCRRLITGRGDGLYRAESAAAWVDSAAEWVGDGFGAAATQAAAAFNQALAAGLASLPAANAGKTLRVYPMDVFTLFNTVVGPPMAAGYSNVTASSQINPLANPDTYLFWDDLHPTTFGHRSLMLTAAGLIAPAVATTTVVTSSGLAANLASPVTLTATVSSASGRRRDGDVLRWDDFDRDGDAGFGGVDEFATATLTTSSLASGTHTIMATYAGTYGDGGGGGLCELRLRGRLRRW